MKRHFLAGFLLAVVGCPSQPPEPIRPATGLGTCENACEKLARLQCVSASTPAGHTCGEVCTYYQQQGVDWHVDCIMSADVTTCADVDRCRQ